MSGPGAGEPDWRSGSNLNGVDRPEVVLAAFARNETMVGVAVIAPRRWCCRWWPGPWSHRTGRSAGKGSSRRRTPRGSTARLHRTVDRRCLVLLRGCPRGNGADDDLWSCVPHRRLPLRLWRHHLAERLLRWRGRTGPARPSP
ncbi:hypothetical protein ACFQ8S_04850 [Streptomyces virginiae]|uniref:hypothetical protein n=1 Tax=Streptomyces virginiae TaxID=1961 RepID=UPI00368C69B1